MIHVEIVSQPAQLDAAVEEMAGSSAIALDTESNSLHHYPEQLCLIQIATREKGYVIDTVALRELTPLKTLLSDDATMKVIHGADYDVRSLDRHCGFHIRSLYDTSIAARFTGITKFGLANLLETVLGVAIRKNKRLQLADWGRRPISAEAIDYAITDVSYLLALHEALDKRLQALGRTAWVAEECVRLEEVRYTEPNLETAYLSIKGTRDLDGRQLALLRSLVLFREGEARRQGRPPFFVIPDTALIYIAASPTTSLAEIPGLGQPGLQRFGRGLQQAIRDGQTAPPRFRSPIMNAERPTPEQIQRLSLLKAWRAPLSAALSLDPSLVWPTSSLERLARAPDTLDAEIASASIRRWQRARFASSLQGYIASLS